MTTHEDYGFDLPVPAKPAPQAPISPPVGVQADNPPQTASPSVQTPYGQTSQSGGWLAVTFIFTTVLFAGLWLRSLDVWPDIGPGPSPNPDVDGTWVTLWYQDTEMGDYSEDAKTALNSVLIDEYLDKHVSERWKRLDVDSDLTGLDDAYTKMADMHKSKLPWIVIMSEKGTASEPITDIETLSKTLKKWVE